MSQSERAFLQARLPIVEEELDRLSLLGDADQTSEVYKHKEMLRRERRLLIKLLDQVPEGKVLQALKQWRREHGRKLTGYNQRTRAVANAADDYWRLSADEREEAGTRPRSPAPGLIIVDSRGRPFVIDYRQLTLLDDLIVRLQRWLSAT
jgi:hypothetical protein